MQPPSVNHYWGVSGKRRYLTAKARAFHAILKLFVKPHKSTARLRAELEFCFTDKGTRDIDNYIKATLDGLVKAGLCVDDVQFDELFIKRGQVTKGGMTKIKIYEIS